MLESEHCCVVCFPIEERTLDYALPEGFQFASMADHYDIFRGFDHEKDGQTFTASQEEIENCDKEFNSANVNKELKTIVLDPQGEFAAYCGMWYDPSIEFAIVEPLATVSMYRKMGLAKAAVYEGIKRCRVLSAYGDKPQKTRLTKQIQQKC